MTNHCPICETETVGTERKRGWFTHHLCGGCGTAVLTQSEGEPAYPDDYFGNAEEKFRGAAGGIRRHWHEKRASHLRAVTGRDARSLYDIGCGDGLFLKSASGQGFSIGGLEPMDKAREQACKKLGCVIDKEPFVSAPEGGFDVITAWQVIEHVGNPGKLFDSVHENLKPGGLFAVSTVNLESWQARIFGSQWLHLDPPRHLWVGRRAEVEKLLEKHGFQVVARRWNHLEFGPVGYVDSFVNLFDTRRDRILKCLKTGFPGMVNKIAWVAAGILTPFSLILSSLEALLGVPSTFELYVRRVG
jgi:SAM-dependent methyltransferase